MLFPTAQQVRKIVRRYRTFLVIPHKVWKLLSRQNYQGKMQNYQGNSSYLPSFCIKYGKSRCLVVPSHPNHPPITTLTDRHITRTTRIPQKYRTDGPRNIGRRFDVFELLVAKTIGRTSGLVHLRFTKIAYIYY